MLEMKSENFIRKPFSFVGTVKCKIHCQPFVNVLSAIALARTVSILTSASEVPFVLVLVLVLGVDVEVGDELVGIVRVFEA